MDGYNESEGGARKRIKISKTSSRPAGNGPASTNIVASDAQMKQEAGPSEGVLLPKTEDQEDAGHNDDGSCHHEQSLRALHTDMDAMRQLITCKMCYRFLYEPYGLTCGHTYCYSCLSQWMATAKTCPDCRARVKEEPRPTWIIREMVRVFVAKSQLLPDGETMEEHEKMASEEAEIVAKDKANTDEFKGGLFRGRFGHRFVALRDQSDNVWRCPRCTNEVEDGTCRVCEIEIHVDSDSDEDSTMTNDDELDGSLADMDHDADVDLGLDGHVLFGSEGFGDGSSDIDEALNQYDEARINYITALQDHPHGHRLLGSELSEDSDEAGSDMDGFIDDDVHYDDDATVDETEDEADSTPGRPYPIASHRPILIDSDDDAEETTGPRRVVPNIRRPAVSDSEGEGESDEGPIASQSSRRRDRRPQVVSDGEEEDSDGPPEDNLVDFSNFGAFSPASVHSDESEEEEDEEEEAAEQPRGTYDTDDNEGEDDADDEHGGDSFSVPQQPGLYGFGRNAQPYDPGEDEDEEANESDDSDERDSTSEPDPASYSHRLHTLGPRRNRHHSPPPSYSSLYPQGNPRVQPTYRASRIPAEIISRAARVAQSRGVNPTQPRHPFQLLSTLARLNASREQDRNNLLATSGPTRHFGPVVDSEDEAEIAEYGSRSSGSSRTLQRDPTPPAVVTVGRRRGRRNRYRNVAPMSDEE
ncbi:putative RING finger protein [Cercospora zeina]